VDLMSGREHSIEGEYLFEETLYVCFKGLTLIEKY